MCIFPMTFVHHSDLMICYIYYGSDLFCNNLPALKIWMRGFEHLLYVCVARFLSVACVIFECVKKNT